MGENVNYELCVYNLRLVFMMRVDGNCQETLKKVHKVKRILVLIAIFKIFFVATDKCGVHINFPVILDDGIKDISSLINQMIQV